MHLRVVSRFHLTNDCTIQVQPGHASGYGVSRIHLDTHVSLVGSSFLLAIFRLTKTHVPTVGSNSTGFCIFSGVEKAIQVFQFLKCIKSDAHSGNVWEKQWDVYKEMT